MAKFIAEEDNLSENEPDRPLPPWSIRSPKSSDAGTILQLVQHSGVLELNSLYAYLLMCQDFPQTCAVLCHNAGRETALSQDAVGQDAVRLDAVRQDAQARPASSIEGFVIAFTPPQRPQALFVWQIGVSQKARRQGFAKRMLGDILLRPENRQLNQLEATVTPSNVASRRMFESFAHACEAPFEYIEWFTADHFGAEQHEPEELIRIGPVERTAIPRDT